MQRSRIAVFVSLALLAGAGGWWWHSRTQQENAANSAQPPARVQVAEAVQRDLPITVKQVGTVVANQTVAVRSRIDSQVVSVAFKDGDAVKEGDVLFVLDDRSLRAQLQQQEAGLARDKAQLTNLKQQLGRTQSLKEREYVSDASLDEARAGYEAQQASVAASEAQIRNMRVLTDYTRITAPIAGRTGTINVTVGNTVKANDANPLVTINQTKPIRVQFSLPQRHLDALRAALAAGPVKSCVRFENSNELCEGRLEYIDNAVDTASGTVAARALFGNEEERLWPGMFVTVEVSLGEEKNALVIPEVAVQRGQSSSGGGAAAAASPTSPGAVQTGSDSDYVFTVKDGKAHKAPVRVSRVQDGLAVITSGLAAGDQVVTDGILSLKDGSPVALSAPQK